jgi:hypothetical protein
MNRDSALRGTVHQTLNSQPQHFYADLLLLIAKGVDSDSFGIAKAAIAPQEHHKDNNMDEHSALQTKADALTGLLDSDSRREHSRARTNHWTGMTLMIVAILASGFAGLGGLTSKLGPQAVGAIALIPGAFALLSTTIKFDGRAMWHYRKKRELDALLRRLKFELPTPPTADQIARISSERSALDKKLDTEWEKEFGLSWGWFHAKGRK